MLESWLWPEARRLGGTIYHRLAVPHRENICCAQLSAIRGEIYLRQLHKTRGFPCVFRIVALRKRGTGLALTMVGDESDYNH